MTLLELAKGIQEDLREGIANIIIWKEGKEWKQSTYWECDEKDKKEAFELINRVKTIDSRVITMNGYYDFACYTLKYIQWHIQRIYDKEITLENIEEN